MDSIDIKALSELMANGRATWADLAGRLGLSGPAISERVHRLEEREVIKGYAALVDPEAVGCALTAFVAVALERPGDRESFLEKISGMAEVQECHHVAGEDDYLLKVRCRGTRDLESLISIQIKGIPGVAKTRTAIVLNTYKETPVLPVLLEPRGEVRDR